MKTQRAFLIYLAIAVGIVAADLVSKEVAFDKLQVQVYQPNPDEPPVLSGPGYGREIPIFESWFTLQGALNRGAFNGWFAGQRWFLLGISALWVLGSALFIWRKPLPSVLVVAIALTAGGAAGNLYDRYMYGAVRDFIKWFVTIDGEQKVWPNFNIADAAIVAGVALILIHEFRRPAPAKQVEGASLPAATSADSARPSSNRPSDAPPSDDETAS